MTRTSNIAAAGVGLVVMMIFAMVMLTSTPGKMVMQAAEGSTAHGGHMSVEDLTNPFYASEFDCVSVCNSAK
jgi:hypothetical protein